MFRNILVPLDFSPENERAISVAAQMAVASDARVSLLHVIETLRDVPEQELEPFYSRLEERAETRMAELGAPLDELGLEGRRDIIYGRRPDGILRHASEQECDLIVLASRSPASRAADGAVSLGTVSSRVSLLADCSVLLVR